MTTIYSTFNNNVISSIESGDLKSLRLNTYAMLLTENYIPDVNHTFEDLERFEFESSNYRPGGQPIAFIPEFLHNGLEVCIQGNDVEWRFLNGSVKYILIYQTEGLKKIPAICQALTENSSIYLSNNNLYVHWFNFYFRVTEKVPAPTPPSFEEISSGVLGKGVLGRMILNKSLATTNSNLSIRID